MRQAGWRRRTAIGRMDKALSLIAACTPSLTPDITDDRHVKCKDAKSQSCCHWDSDLLPSGCHAHTVLDKSTNYLNVIVGVRRAGTSIKEKAHRLMCYSLYGPPPSAMHNTARHICNNIGGKCINPYHLEWSTSLVNTADVNELKRARAAARAGSSKMQDLAEREGAAAE